MDWKVLVVDVNDPLAPRLNDIEDVERHLPGLVRATNEWFRIYKIPDGKPEVSFASALGSTLCRIFRRSPWAPGAGTETLS